MTSRTGRSTARNRSLPADAMPTGTPMMAQKTTAVTIIESVVIVSDHRPIMSTKKKERIVKIATPLPAARQAMRAKIAVMSSIGTALSSQSRLVITMLTGSCAARKNGRKFGTRKPRTKLCTQSSKGIWT